MVFNLFIARERGIVSAFRTCLSRVTLLALVAALPGSLATADIIHKVRFKADAQIILWGQDIQQSEAQLYEQPPAPQPALLAAAAGRNPVIVTGRLIPLHQISNTPAYAIEQNGLSSASFYIASNTPYGIRAEITQPSPPLHELKNTAFQFGVSHVGKSAYQPESSPLAHEVKSLDSLIRPAIIFQSSRRTAARPGSLAEQSVRFAANWEQSRQGEAIDITFTVFVP